MAADETGSWRDDGSALAAMSTPPVIIVSGWRFATEAEHGDYIRSQLLQVARLFAGRDILPILKHGKCPKGGVDLICAVAAGGWGWDVRDYPPEIRNGRVIGSPRNRRMVFSGGDVLVAFPAPASTGTIDCLKWAIRAGLPSMVYPLTAKRSPAPRRTEAGSLPGPGRIVVGESATLPWPGDSVLGVEE